MEFKLEYLYKGIMYYLIFLFGLIWFQGIIGEFRYFLNEHDYSIFFKYAEISLTFFGFTLVSGILGTKDEIKNKFSLMTTSLMFLFSSISFLAINSISYIQSFKDTIQFQVIVYSFGSLLILGFLFFIIGIIQLSLFMIAKYFNKENN